MKLITFYVTDEEAEVLRAEADRNIRYINDQAHWWVRQAIDATVDSKTSVLVRVSDKSKAQAVAL